MNAPMRPSDYAETTQQAAQARALDAHEREVPEWKQQAIRNAAPYCLACEIEGHRTHECHSTHGFNTPRDMEIARLSWGIPK